MRSISSPTSLVALPEDRPALRYLAKVRWPVLLVALALAAAGLATIHSASSELSIDYMPRQAIWVVLGLVVFLVGFGVDYLKLAKFALPIYLASLVLLVAVLLFGQEVGGARSLARLRRLAAAAVGAGEGGDGAVAGALSGGLQPSRSGPQGGRRGGGHRRRADGAGGAEPGPRQRGDVRADAARHAGAGRGQSPPAGGRARCSRRWSRAGAWNLVLLDYQKDRVRTYLSPGSDPLGDGYQLRQSKIAVGSGQLAGRGYGQGTQSQLRFLPARHTDFIFAVLAEEWGFLGVGVRPGRSSGSTSSTAPGWRRGPATAPASCWSSGCCRCSRRTSLYNTAMVVGLVPITGIPLPFLSYGGSFTLANFFATGLILGVDFRRYVNR